jgi:ferritin
MMTEKLQKALNEQITAELWSANLYLSMSFFLLREGYEGFAHWMRKQSAEETKHANEIAEYMVNRQAIPRIDKIDVVPQNWGSAREAFEDAYKHECHVSKLIDLLVKIASEEKDNATQDFLWGFVREQVEEEASTLAIVDKLKRTGDAGLLFMNFKLNERT